MNKERRPSALITRPQHDAAVLARSLERRGITPVLEPMMQTEFFEEDIDADINESQAILFTSRNGVRSFSRVSDWRNIPVFAVGDSTGALAKDIGFEMVESAAGNSDDLAQLIIERLSPRRGPLIHITGKTVAGDLSGSLSAAGFEVVRRTLYEAKPISVLSAKTQAAIRGQEIDYVLFFSPRTAGVFMNLIAAAGLKLNCQNLEAICLSEAVAAELPAADWLVRRTASEPTTDSLLNSLDNALGSGHSVLKTTSGDELQSLDLEPLRRAIERARSAADASVGTTLPSQPEDEFKDEPIPLGNPLDPQPPPDQDDLRMPENDITVKPSEKQEQSIPGGKILGRTPASAESHSRVPTVGWTLVIVFSILLAGYFTLPIWRGELPKYVQERLTGVTNATKVTDSRLEADVSFLKSQNNSLRATVAGLKNSLDELRSRLTVIDEIALRQSVSETAREELRVEVRSATKTLSSLGIPTVLKRIDELEKSISGSVAAQSDQALGEQKLDQRIAALTDRIEVQEAAAKVLKKELRTPSSGDLLALAIGQLRDALSRTRPFEAELATLKRLAGDNVDIFATIAPIEPMAVNGVPSRADLLSRLPGVVDASVAAIRITADGDWIDRTVSKLRGFLIVRRIDGKGDGPDALLARAESAANRGDLLATTLEIAKLNTNSSVEVSAWLYDARARLAAEVARTALNRIALNELEPEG